MCGTAAAEKKILRVADVREFPGHIACDGESRSEIVVPVLGGKGGEVSWDGEVLAEDWLSGCADGWM